jgi:hypothetical protein
MPRVALTNKVMCLACRAPFSPVHRNGLLNELKNISGHVAAAEANRIEFRHRIFSSCKALTKRYKIKIPDVRKISKIFK